MNITVRDKLSTIIAAVTIVISFAAVSEAGWYDTSWLYRKPITISNSMVADTNQTNFPVLIYLASDSDIASHAQSDGDDIMFTSSDGTTKLSHEIEKYTSATGQLYAWVKIPTLSASSNTTLYMYYGNDSCSSQQNATGVWDSNYKGVWHMPNGTTLTANDATSNANNGTIYGATAGTGQIDGGGALMEVIISVEAGLISQILNLQYLAGLKQALVAQNSVFL